MDEQNMNYAAFNLLILLGVFFTLSFSSEKVIPKGRYTLEVGTDYVLVYPQRAHPNGSFASYSLAQFYDWPVPRRPRGRRMDSVDAQLVHYLLPVGLDTYLLELEPNDGLLAPAMVVERRGAWLNETTIATPMSHQCHYTGSAHGRRGVRAALSLCDGMVGYVRTAEGVLHFVEPASGAKPETDGRLAHVVYRRSDDTASQHAESAHSVLGFCSVQGDWKEAWAQRFEYELSVNPDYSGKRLAAEQNGGPRYVEVVVVVDKRFVAYHEQGRRDTEQYILAIMNMVSAFYHDGSIGHLINVNIVRIIYLNKEYEEFDVLISADATKTLKNFCDWQFKINPSIDHPNHHDIAVLITKYDICSDPSGNSSCGLLGLANVAQACNPRSSCCINEDSGLSLGITIAHEMGHVMGIEHDAQPPVTCPAVDPATGANYVMSPTVTSNTLRWSNCSRDMITRFFEYGLGDCLLDEPADHSWQDLPDMPVGAVYDADQQCSLQYRMQTTACNFGTDSFCRRLDCRKGSSCWTNGQPPMDGTPCANNKWCYHKKCVPVGMRAAAVNGGWGDWGLPSECSRSCGGGVSKMERDCNNPPPANRGKYCTGGRRRYQLCNTQPCPVGQPTFYEEQCSEKNAVTFLGQNHTWKPYKPGTLDKPCALVCINENSVYSTLSPRVKDGTPCKTGTKDRCIAGKCRSIGCDWVLDSNTAEDNCGMCAGNGSTCSFVEKTYTATSGSGYVKVDVIPKGSTNVHVAEMEPSYNIISVADEAENFFLNKKFRENRNGEYDFGGVTGVYNHPIKDKEDLIIKGPTTINLVLYYVWFGAHKNPGLAYSYYEPLPRKHMAKLKSPLSDTYWWELLEWSPCSANCGGGAQVAVPVCVKDGAGKVDDSFCREMVRPATVSRVCNQHDCRARWHMGPWRHCCHIKSNIGYQVRRLACLQEPQKVGGEAVFVNDEMCSERRPNAVRRCRNPQYCYRFRRYSELARAVARGFTADPTVNEALVANRVNTHDSYRSSGETGDDFVEVDYYYDSPLWGSLDNAYQALLEHPPRSGFGMPRNYISQETLIENHNTWDRGLRPASPQDISTNVNRYEKCDTQQPQLQNSESDYSKTTGRGSWPRLVQEGGGKDLPSRAQSQQAQEKCSEGAELSTQEHLAQQDGNEVTGPGAQPQLAKKYGKEDLSSGSRAHIQEDGSEATGHGGEDLGPSAPKGQDRGGDRRAGGPSSQTRVILDRAPKPFLMEVPLVRKQHELWLSEQTKEELGDRVPDLAHAERLVPDTNRARNYTDEAAIRKLDELRAALPVPPGA